MKYQVTPQQITNELYNIFSDDSRAAQYLTGSHPEYLGVLGWCGPMSPMNRAAFLSAFGAEQVAKAEQEARARVAEYRAAVDRSTYHRNEVAADAFELSDEVPAVGSFVWGRWSCMNGEGGPLGELEDLERMDHEGRENPRRLCEVVAVVDASPAEFLDREACNRIARQFQDMGGSRYDEQDPQSLKGFPLTWELVFCVRCAGRWFLIDGQGYDYTRYFLMPDSYGRMFAPELDAIRADREAKEAAERAAEQAAKEERRRQYLERCAPWWGRLVDVEPLQDAEKSAPRGSDAMKAARRALQAAQRKNILTMCRAAFPGVKFACRRSNGWGASFVISWTDGPTEERFKEVAAVDLLFSTGEYYSNMDDSYSCDAKEFQDFAAKYMGYTYGSYECRRDESAEFKAEICAKIRAAVPGIPEDGKIRENAQQSAVCALFADVPGVRLSVIVDHLDYNGITAAAWYIAKHTDRPATDGSPTTPTGTDGQGAKGQGVEGETTEVTPSEGSTGAAYGIREKSPNFDDFEECSNLLVHHQRMKGEHPEAVLLYRMGDFYEAYFQDSQTVADCLGITRRLVRGYSVAGFPFHALDAYLPKLIRAGHRVAICDDPRPFTRTNPEGRKESAYWNPEKSQLPEKMNRKEQDGIAAAFGLVPESHGYDGTLYMLKDAAGYPVKNAKGETLQIHIDAHIELTEGPNSNPALWQRKGYTRDRLTNWWSIRTYCTREDGLCVEDYNPTVLDNGKRFVINFDWMLTITAENLKRIIAEVLNRFYGDSQKSQIFEDVAVSVPEVQEYKLKYFWGAWITKETIYAETDEEAIHDADEIYKEDTTLHTWNGVALVQGDRFIKNYRPIRCDENGRMVRYNIETVNGKNRKVYI